MSTSHVIYSDSVNALELTEHSTKLDIDMYIDGEEGVSINDLTPLQVQDIAIRLIECASYSSEDDIEYFIDTIKLLAEKRNIKFHP